jgi:hypothetical protein
MTVSTESKDIMSPHPPPEIAPAPEAPTARKKKTNLSYWIAGIVIAALIALTAFFVDVQAMMQVVLHTNPLLVLAGVVFLLGGVFLIDLRWWYLLGRKEEFGRLAHATNASYIVPILTPIPNYISRVVITGMATEVTFPQATTGMMVERMIAQIMRITTIVLAISLGVQSSMSPASMFRSILFSIAVLAGYLLAIHFSTPLLQTLDKWLGKMPKLNDKHRTKIVDIIRDALSIDVGTRDLLIALGMTVIMWTLFFLFHFMVILAMPLGLDMHANVTIALGALALTPPSAPAMLGIYQLSQVGPNLVLRLGSLEQLLPYSLVLYFIQAIVWLALTLWGLRALNMGFIDLFRQSKKGQASAQSQR